ncbi:MAG: FtsX-like permease family protein [Acidobacteriia bacterium]|nr:FtsX-like permease family protein [Terriglobia bacterium]
MFVLRMAARETRSSWRRLLFFFICIAVGVAAIVTLRSVIQSVRQVFGTEAKALIAGDLLIATNREWTPEARQTIDRRLADAGVTDRTETMETPTMVRPADRTRQVAKMAELRAVQRGFPLYGAVELQGGQTYSHALLEGHGALVRPELLTSIGVAVGDQIIIGQTAFTIRGVIAREPGRGMGEFSLGPRVIIDFDDLPSTGLLSFGSRARRVVLVKLPDESRIEALVTTLRDDFRDDFINTRSFRSTEDQVGRDFDRAENYLSLVGLIIVILGGIAVSSVTRVFILQKIRSIAVLKCVGARSTQIVAVYLLQVVTLGLAGSLLGVALARGVVAAIPMALGGSTSLLATVHYGVTWSAATQGVGIGVLVSLLFSVVPLLHVRFIKPSLLLRDETVRRRMDWLGLGVLVAVSAALVALTAWQAASLKAGLVVCAGFAGLAFVLQLAGQGLITLVKPLAMSKSFPLRHAVLHLSRPGNQTRVILLAVGLGAFFIVGVRSLQGSLLSEFSVQVAADGPDMFLLDVQRAQADGVRAFLADPARDIGDFQLIPVLRGRVVGVSGRETNLEGADEVRQRGNSIGREFTLTYRDRLESNERVVDGAFWNGPSTEPEVSIEKQIAERAKIHVGDTMRFDILGQTVSPKVTSIRDVEWRESRNGGFVFVFRPGVLDKAPQTFVAPFRGPHDVTARARFQHDLVERFPNVSVIDFHEVLETIRDVMSKVTLAITVVGGLVLLSGVLILIGAVAMTKFQRVYEAAVFKTLGANTRTIAKMLLIEYGVLGSLAGLIGSLGAVALTWGVSKYALEIPWRIFPSEHTAGVLLTALLVAVIGVLSSLEVLRNKPLATLRAE